MKQKLTGFGLIGAFTILTFLAGCASQVQNKENLLIAAGFKVIVPKTDGDVVLWFAYPKGTSKRVAGEINRDTGWEPLLSAGFETVRLVAIDEDWSALRFRRAAYVGGKKPR